MEMKTFTGRVMRVPIAFRIPISEYERLTDIARAEKTTLSDISRRLLRVGLNSIEGKSRSGN